MRSAAVEAADRLLKYERVERRDGFESSAIFNSLLAKRLRSEDRQRRELESLILRLNPNWISSVGQSKAVIAMQNRIAKRRKAGRKA